MKKSYKSFNSPESPEDLFEKVMLRINREKRIMAVKRRIILFFSSLIGSLIAFIPVLKMFLSGIEESGFLKFLSLILSDTDIAVSYWQNFTMSLLESLPATGLIVLSIVVLVFLESVKLLVKNLKVVYGQKRMINI